MAALLTSKSDKVQKISIVINDCKRLDIKVSPPNVNKSDIEFTALPENNEILFGLLAVKGLGESIVDKIVENRPYQSMNDFIEKVADKTAIITLIKAGAIPTKDKMLSLKKYANRLFERKDYKPVTTLPSPYSKLIPFGLNVDDYRDGKKVNKEALLIDYNKAKEKLFIEEQNQKYKNHMMEFQEKYAKDEYMWEFDTLSMFLTNDPWNRIRDKIINNYLISDIITMLKPLGVTYTMIKKLLTDEPNPALLKQQLEEEYCVVTYTDIFGKDKLIEYTKKELAALDLAYAMTVHKLQGAGRKIVIGIIDNTHHQLLDNCMLYTLLTRAKKRCLLLAEPQAFLQCIRTSHDKRNTWMMLEEKVA